MTTKPHTGRSISIAISTMDRPEALRSCLMGILSGSERPLEIVVVDQSAAAESRRVSETLAEEGAPIVYRRHEGRGLAASQNEAVATARGEIVAVIDDDCVPERDWLERVGRSFALHPETTLVTGRVLPLPTDDSSLVPVSLRSDARARVFRGVVPPWLIGSGNNFAVRREAFLRIGGCDVRLGPGSPGRGGVDMDLFYRLVRAGRTARYDPAVVVYHEQKPYAERFARRSMYGFGTGACFGLWFRAGDGRALHMMVRWLTWRSARLIRAGVSGDMTRAREEAVMVATTFRGFGYGLRAAEAPTPASARREAAPEP